MFDFDLQMRFWRSMTDVMVHSAQASMAAASAVQDQVTSGAGQPAAASVTDNPALWWLTLFQPPTVRKTGFADAASMFNPFLMMAPWMAPWANVQPSWGASAWGQSAWGARPNAWPSVGGTAFPMPWSMPPMATTMWGWPSLPWVYMQMPLTAMLVSAGYPIGVAVPSAKASTAAMDAADAAREQMEKVYSAYRSDGGHAAAQLVSLPWTMAAAFIGSEPAPTRSIY